MSCSAVDKVPQIDSVCEGLRGPIDIVVNEVLEYDDSTPESVILAVTKLTVAYDGGCPNG